MKNKKLNQSTKAFLVSIAVIFVLMVLAYVITLILPAGSYDRVLDDAGNLVIDTNSEFKTVEGGISFWKWLASPFLVLGAEGNALLIAIIAFLLVIGGAFKSVEECGIFEYMLRGTVKRFGRRRYNLMAILIFFFMAIGSLVGSFEEVVPLTPIVVSLAVALGWDPATGFAISLLAAGCGFAAGVMNPFSVGVAQSLAGLPMFSGLWYRAVAFACIYLLLLGFVLRHAKKVEQPIGDAGTKFEYDKKKSAALLSFAIIVGLGILVVISSTFLTFLQDYTMIIIAVMFLIAGIVATLVSGAGLKKLLKNFGSGALSMVPAVFMILMASSIKYILQEAGTLDTILHGVIAMATKVPSWAVIIFIYLVVLLMNFFVASGSAKAFMIMPLIVPLAQVFGIPAQLCVMAYAFGDGFSNVFYPTNPALLVGLNLSGIGYGKWAKFSWKFQLLNLLLTSLLLMVGIWIGYC